MVDVADIDDLLSMAAGTRNLSPTKPSSSSLLDTADDESVDKTDDDELELYEVNALRLFCVGGCLFGALSGTMPFSCIAVTSLLGIGCEVERPFLCCTTGLCD